MTFHSPSSGRIEVVCGCMFSGKTEELIRRVRQVQIARQPFIIFSPNRDTRYGTNLVASHIGSRLEAVPVASIREIMEQVEDQRVVAVDEIHFLEDDPADVVKGIQQLAELGKRVIVSGLDQTYRAEPFPAMASLMALADQVDKLFAICVRCGAYANRTQRLINGKPAPADAPTIMVGGLELYEARCRECYMPAM